MTDIEAEKISACRGDTKKFDRYALVLDQLTVRVYQVYAKHLVQARKISNDRYPQYQEKD